MQAQNRTIVELDSNDKVVVRREWFVRPGQWKPEPVGTNLFDYTQAEAMVRYMIEGLPAAPSGSTPAETEKK